MPIVITEELDRLYGLRADDAHSVLASLTIIEQHFHATPRADAYELLWRLSRACFFLGQCAENDPIASRSHHRAGAVAGGQAACVAPKRVEGHFWQGVNLALRAQVEQAWRALPLALTARRALRRALAIDHAYHDAGALRVLARLESRLPRPFGSSRRAAQLFARAVEIAPTNTVTRRYFSEHLLEAGDLTAATEHLRAILDLTPDLAWEYETRRDKVYARETLRKL